MYSFLLLVWLSLFLPALKKKMFLAFTVYIIHWNNKSCLPLQSNNKCLYLYISHMPNYVVFVKKAVWSGKISLLHPTYGLWCLKTKLVGQNILDVQNKVKISTGQIILYNQYFTVLYYSFIYTIDWHLSNRKCS